MKKGQLLKVACALAVFGALSFGISTTKTVEKIAGEELTTTVVTIGTTANATCTGSGGIGKGKCTSGGRCGAVYPGETSDCDGDDIATGTRH